ncbi:DUF6348 family protein [Chitinophaga sp. Hz27]|uniref:DUF6348 family protein n=1 Tax=Chitinophaga sp. Hz27 TaxID=3347169 RepID=UPI0035DC13BF
MGFFDFLKKKDAAPEPGPAHEVTPDEYLYSSFKEQLLSQHYHTEEVNANGQHALLADGQVLLLAQIIPTPGMHPQLVQVMFQASHELFPEGITEMVAGIGDTVATRLDSAIRNYMSTTLPPIMDSLTDSHYPELDFTDQNDIHWHPKPGNIGFQGSWDDMPDDSTMLQLLTPALSAIIPNRQFNWIKIYFSMDKSAELSASTCLLNNEEWPEGFAILKDFVLQWAAPGHFKGIKQFIMLRRCDGTH